MADSLVLGRLIELLGGAPSQIPQCAGAVFRLGRSFGLGDPVPAVDLITTLLGDGTRPSGWRVDNRVMELPVTILVPATGDLNADRLTLAAAREVLLSLTAQDQFTLVWGPDGAAGARNLIWDCWRAKSTVTTWDLLRSQQRVSDITITFEAMPYGRSDALTALSFDSPVTGQVTPPSQVILDDYSTVSTSTQGTWWTQSPVTALYSYAARWHHDLSDKNSPLWYTRSGIGPFDITGLTKITFWFGMGADAGRYWHWHRGAVSFTFTLTDGSGRTVTFGTQQVCDASENQEWPRWTQVSASIPQGRAFSYNAVTGYSVKAWSETHTWNGTVELDPTGYLSGLRAAYPSSPKRPASNRGGSYVLYDTDGTAPAPLNVHCQLGQLEQIATTSVVMLPGTPGTVNQFTAPPENPDWLQGDTATFDGGTAGSWTAADGLAANASLAASATQKHAGAYSLRVTPVTGGTSLTAAHCAAANIAAQGLPCAPGDRIALRGYARAGTTGRTVTIGAEFFSSGGGSLGITALPGQADTSTGWAAISGRVTAPASAAWCRMTAAVATPAAGEYHYLDDLYLAYAVQAEVACVAGGGGAGSTYGTKQNAAGGGGGPEIAWETSLDLNPGAAHAYSIAAGGAPGTPTPSGGNGADGGDSYFTGMSVTVRAHGGKGGHGAWNPWTSGTGGAAGTGSVNSHHYDGGAGASGDYSQWEGGGGGGAAGDGGPGGAAGSGGQWHQGAGGPAGALGIAGGAGAAGYGGQATGTGWGGDVGGAGNYPGGGGGGSASDTYSHRGSAAANGLIRVKMKSYITRGQFPALVVHKPSARTPMLAKLVLPAGAGADPPDGREYTIDQVDGQNARYNGTYTVVLAGWSWSGTAARTVTVTVRQYEYLGGQQAAASASASVTPSQVVNGLLMLGEITLPVKDMPPDNTDSYFTVAVTSGVAADRFLDVLLLDTQGTSFTVNLPSGGGYTDYYIDAPDLAADLGRVSGAFGDRSAAVSVLGSTLASGGPLRLEPGDNILMVYSPSGQPAMEASYWPHWWHERLT